jgi:hypothetical protein
MSAFQSSYQKLNNAKKHIDSLEVEIESFTRMRPYEKIEEPDPEEPQNTVHKLRLTSQLPDAITDTTADAIANIRNALDHAGYTCATASGKADPKNCSFPFGDSLEHLNRKGGTLSKSTDIPEAIQSLFVGFKPYKGGDDLLWALHKLNIADKHKITLPIGSGIFRRGVKFSGAGYWLMPEPHVWDREKNEMVIITLGPETKYDVDMTFDIFVAFNGIEHVDGQPVLPVLQELHKKVESIVNTIEAEAKRLNVVP